MNHFWPFVLRKFSQKSFRDIPTLPTVPLLGNSYIFLPIIGRYKSERLTEAVCDLSKTLGQIFRLNLGRFNLLITTNADHVETLFRNEGKLPFRPPFPALLDYRLQKFKSAGIVPGNGEDWYRYRAGVTPLLKRSVIECYVDEHEKVAATFVEYVKRKRNSNFVLEDIFEHLLKFTIEAISVVSPGYRFNCLDTRTTQQTESIMKASDDFMDGLYSTLIGLPVWKICRTSGYRKLESSHEVIYGVIKTHLEEARRLFETDPDALKRNPFMFSLLSNKNFKWQDVLMLSMEIFLGGIDATATTLALTFHYLAHNPSIQQLAREEAQASEPGLPFLRACVKETLRLSPTAGANSRFLPHDVAFGDFLIPKNTLVSAFNSVISLNDKYFDEPSRYYPQRWIRGEARKVHPFASLPFGYGARMCPGMRLAEQEMVVLLRKMLTSFKLQPTDESESIGMVYRMNRIPDRKINIRFINTNL